MTRLRDSTFWVEPRQGIYKTSLVPRRFRLHCNKKKGRWERIVSHSLKISEISSIKYSYINAKFRDDWYFQYIYIYIYIYMGGCKINMSKNASDLGIFKIEQILEANPTETTVLRPHHKIRPSKTNKLFGTQLEKQGRTLKLRSFIIFTQPLRSGRI